MPFISSVRGNFGPQGRGGRSLVNPLNTSTGGTITTSGDWRIHTFTGAGTYTFTASGAGDVEVLVVGGGGAAGAGNVAGAGGGGGIVYRGQTAVSAGAITVTVGAGGTSPGGAGGNSTFGTLTALGGGGGISEGLVSGVPTSINNGGSGSGAGYSPGGNDYTVSTSGTPGTASQPGSASGGFGFRGGRGARQTAGHETGGGGGAGTPGADGYFGLLRGGRGGTGRPFSTSGTDRVYYGGGGGGSTWTGGFLIENGGRGGGGRGGYNGSSNPETSVAGTNNFGGGAGSNGNGTAKVGGTGTVIVRYPTLLSYWTDGDGSSSLTSAYSAQSILTKNGSAADGVYWIRPKGYNGAAFQVYCAFNSGVGWMRVGYEAIGVGGGFVNLEAVSNESNLSTNAVSSSGLIGSRFSQSQGHYSTVRIQWDTTRLTTFTQGNFVQFDVDFEMFENNFLTDAGRNELSNTQTQPGGSNWNNRWVTNYSTNNGSLNYGASGATFARVSNNGSGVGDSGYHGKSAAFDTVWGVKDRRDMKYSLGCNDGGWTSDYVMLAYPGGSYTGGGFTGVSTSGTAKNGITTNNVIFWIK